MYGILKVIPDPMFKKNCQPEQNETLKFSVFVIEVTIGVLDLPKCGDRFSGKQTNTKASSKSFSLLVKHHPHQPHSQQI